MKDTLLMILFVAVVSLLCIGTGRYLSDESSRKFTRQTDSLATIIQEQQEEIDRLEDEVQFKECEISYWGHKYDSIFQVRTNQ